MGDTLIFNPFLKNLNFLILLTLLSFINYPTFYSSLNIPLSSYLNSFLSLFYIISDYTYIIFAILLNILISLSTLYPFYTLTTLIFNNNFSGKLTSFIKTFNSSIPNKLFNSDLDYNTYSNLIVSNQFQINTQKVDFFFENSFYK